MPLNTSHEVWKTLGKDAYSKVRSEIVGTGDGTTSVFDLDHDNVISGSETIYTGGTTASVTINYDDGKITFSSPPPSSSEITADYDYADVPDSVTQDILDKAYNFLTTSTGRTFTTGSSTEYIDVGNKEDEFFLSNYPVTSINYVSCNTASSVTDTPAWSASTEGVGNDYLLYSDEGKIRFIDNHPLKGPKRIKVDYVYGVENLGLAKELELLLAQRQMINSAVYKSIFKGYDNFTPVRLDEIENRINELMSMLRKQSMDVVPD